MVFIPGLLLALIVRADAKMIGPYFALSELIPGLPGFDAPIWHQRAALRWAVLRRFAYPLLCGALLAILNNSLITVILAGSFGAFLLIWPAVFTPRPAGVSASDWRYVTLNTSLLFGFASVAALGSFIIEIMTALGGGDIGQYVLENFLTWIITFFVTVICLAFTKGTFMGLKESAERRREDARSVRRTLGSPGTNNHE